LSTKAPAWPTDYARHVLPEVDSTNAEALRLASGLTGPAWIMARTQTAARGRRGRAWISARGNFAASLLMRPAGDPAHVALRSFTAALALADTLAMVCGPQAQISLKWPNDVLLNGAKVAGILLESAGQGASVSHLIVGIGVNLAQAPPPGQLEAGAMAPTSVLDATGLVVTPDEVLDYLAPAFARYEGQLVTYGFQPIRTAWLARAARLGQPVTARTMSETIEGRFETLADDGALVLLTANGRRAIPAADVFF